MNKIALLSLSAAMSLALAACGDDSAPVADGAAPSPARPPPPTTR